MILAKKAYPKIFSLTLALLIVATFLALHHKKKIKRLNKQLWHLTQEIHQKTQEIHQKKFIPPMHVQDITLKEKNGLILRLSGEDQGITQTLLKQAVWEPHIQNVFKKIITPGQRVVCLGAHIGTHALLISKLVGNRGHVFMFEPNPFTRSYLKENIARNQASNVTLYPFGASDKNGTIPFILRKKNTGDSLGAHVHGAQTWQEKDQQTIQIEIRMLDSLPELSNIHVLQMDIQGMEPEAIAGAEKFIAKNPNMIIIQEWEPSYIKDPEAYLNFWWQKGYQIARIIPNPSKDGPFIKELKNLEDVKALPILTSDLIIARQIPKTLLSS